MCYCNISKSMGWGPWHPASVISDVGDSICKVMVWPPPAYCQGQPKDPTETQPAGPWGQPRDPPRNGRHDPGLMPSPPRCDARVYTRTPPGLCWHDTGSSSDPLWRDAGVNLGTTPGTTGILYLTTDSLKMLNNDLCLTLHLARIS